MGLKIVLVFSIIAFAASAPADHSKAAPSSVLNPEEQGGYFEGDMILDDNEKAMVKSGVKSPSSRWPNRTVYYKLGKNFTSTEKTQISKGIQEIATKTKNCIKFKEVGPKDAMKNYIMVDNQGAGCNSEVGYQGRVQKLNLNANCFGETIGRISHEFIHALGFHHEQSRTDRDDFVTIIKKNIKKGEESQFTKYGKNEVDPYNVTYDYGSVMHYKKDAFGEPDGAITIVPRDKNAKIGQRDGLSPKDAQKIRNMYGC